MVKEQIERRGIEDTAILQAMRIVPRHHFVMKMYQYAAYDDTPLPIPANQTISQPYVVALMLTKLQLQSSDRVLEIGTGSGYAAALLSRIVAKVYSVERHETLIKYAQYRLTNLAYTNVYLSHNDGTLGWPAHAPYNAIIVAAGGPIVPPTLKEQLTIGGRLVMPVGRKKRKQALVRVTRLSETTYDKEVLSPVAFVPLIGAEGW